MMGRSHNEIHVYDVAPFLRAGPASPRAEISPAPNRHICVHFISVSLRLELTCSPLMYQVSWAAGWECMEVQLTVTSSSMW